MVRDQTEPLCSFCREELGDALRAITYYSPEDHEPVYTRSDVPDELQLEEATREMFRYPLVQMQKAMW